MRRIWYIMVVIAIRMIQCDLALSPVYVTVYGLEAHASAANDPHARGTISMVKRPSVPVPRVSYVIGF